MELSLNTYSECVDSFRTADQLMAQCWRQKLTAYQRALELAGPEPERGFQSQFARDCNCGPAYISKIARITANTDLLRALNKHRDIAFNTALALSALPREKLITAIAELDQNGGDLSAIGIESGDSGNTQSQRAKIEQKFGGEQTETVDGDFTEIDNTEPDLSNIKIDPASIAIGNTEIEQLATFVGLCGSTASLYNNQSGEQLTAETFSGFVVNNFVQQLDSLDPSHRADHYSFLLNNLTELVGLLQQTIELIPTRIPLKSIS